MGCSTACGCPVLPFAQRRAVGVLPQLQQTVDAAEHPAWCYNHPSMNKEILSMIGINSHSCDGASR